MSRMAQALARRGNAQTAYWPAASANLYRLWIECPERVIAEDPARLGFNPAERATAALWSARQGEFGLRADLHDDMQGEPAVLEVFGADGLVPHCIIYASLDGVQTDEFDGTSRVYATLESALHAIAPMW